MPLRRRPLFALGAFALAPALLRAAPALQAPNVVPISPTLVTSGQPTRAALQALGADGFQAVIYLAPSSVSDAIADEPNLLRRQGIEFIHVPIPFGAPQEQHYLAFAEALGRLSDKKVLVHCQVNMRASSMVFLYRTLALRQAPATAYEAVAKVWSPHGPWRDLIVTLLRQHQIDFEPY